MLRALIAFALLAPHVASADADPQFAAGLDYTAGHGGQVGELALGVRLEPGLFVRVGRWHATLSVPWQPKIESTNLERDGERMTGVGVGARLGYRMPLFGGTLAISAGMARYWAFGADAVVRTCTQTRECVAGTYFEKPSYHAWAPQLRIGIGREALVPSMLVGVTFEIIIEAIAYNDVPPDGIRGGSVMPSLTFTLGGARKKPRPPQPPPQIGQNL